MTGKSASFLNNLLAGLRLESVRLTTGSVTLEFDRIRDGEHFRFSVGKNYYVCCNANLLFKKDIGNDNEELASLYGCLERDFSVCRLGQECRSIEIRLSGSRSIFAWSDGPPTDNLLRYTNENTSDWGVIG